MPFDKKEMIEKLKLELEILEKGGYAPSEHEPHRMPRVFRDSVSCPNVGLEIKIEPCSHCFLMEFVPPEHRDKEDACHYILLNRRGDTITSLDRKGNEAGVQAALRTWLQKTIFRLAEESGAPMSAGEGRPRHLLPPDERRSCLLLPPGNRTSTS
jgi:hypothetical protein